MKKKLQKYLSGEREGFSLVELIIVIAIMAILIGIIALAVLPYLERSRESKDKQTLDTVYGAFQTALSEEKAAIAAAGTSHTGLSAVAESALPVDVKTQVEKNLGSTIVDAEKKLVSQNATGGKFAFTYVPPTSTNPSGEITVTIGNPPVKDGDGNDFKSSSKADSTTSSGGGD